MPKLKLPFEHQSIFIKSTNVIDVKTGNLLRNRDILLQDNVIIAVDTSGILKSPPNSLIIDGTNKYVIPGLWDMHTHSNQYSEWLHHPLFIANGVTGIRDMSGQLNKKDSYFVGSKERLNWSKELNVNKRISPRYVLQSSFQMDGAFSVPSGFPEFFKVQKNEDVDSLLNFYRNENVDFIKVYNQFPPITYKRLLKQAPHYGIHVAGHKPMFISLQDAISSGQKSFEHGRIFLYECFPKADSLRQADNWKEFLSKSKKSMVTEFNPEVATDLMLLMKRHNAHWCPTLQTLKFEAFAHDSLYLENPNLKYIDYISRKLLWSGDVKNNKEKNLSKEKNISGDFYGAAKVHTKMASELGVPIMAGTDVGDTYIFAGFSLHDELQDLNNSGMSNLEALQSATIVPAKFCGLDKVYGTVENGKKADLVILDKNPLDNINNSRMIFGVIVNGLYYNSKKIDELKNFTASLSSSFHVNTKVLYSLISSPLMRVQWAD